MAKPDFFIVGAPKSGTTSVYDYLKQHPGVFFPVKEICYFCPDFTMLTPHLTENMYLSYYKGAAVQKVIGDGFIFHLLSTESAKEIKAFNPDAKIVIMLRNPVQMVPSFHNQLVFNGDEPIMDLEEALDAESDRRTGKHIPPNRRCPLEAYFYSDIARYYEQVLRYQSVFSADKMHIIFYEDFKADTGKEYAKLLKFLELEEIMPDSFERVNRNMVVRSKAYLRFLMSPPRFIKSTARVLLPHHSPRRKRVMDKLWDFNAKHAPRPSLPSKLKQRLVHIYKDDIEKLGKLLNRDLSNWLTI